MTTTRKPIKVKDYDVKKELAKVDKLFKSIDQDKTLPTFGNFFMECLIRGNAENVNLKVMYPSVYKRCSTWLNEHREKILAMRESVS